MIDKSASQRVVLRDAVPTRHSPYHISWIGLSALLALLLFGQSWIAADEALNPPPCTLPFDSIKVHQTIDDACGVEGKKADGSELDPGHKLQNRVKNDFCVPGPAVGITANMFRRLQQIIDQKAAAGEVTYGDRDNLPTSRTVFVGPYELPDDVSLGEGRLVQFAGFIQRAHAGQDESCNCERTRIENHDIHLDLAATKNAPECKRIIAEVSPHWRPAAWVTRKFTKVKKQGFPVPLTGQLFFDAAHVACNRGGVKRTTEWEIHPVYHVDVATTKSLPSADDDLKWVPLEQWLASHP